MKNFDEISAFGGELFIAQTSVENLLPYEAELIWSKKPIIDSDFDPFKPSIFFTDGTCEIKYNASLRITAIPEKALSIKFGTRSALEWVIDRLSPTIDKNSGIANSAKDFFGSSEECLNYVLKVIQAGVLFAELTEKLSEISLD